MERGVGQGIEEPMEMDLIKQKDGRSRLRN